MIDTVLGKLSQLALAVANLVFVTAMAVIEGMLFFLDPRRPSR